MKVRFARAADLPALVTLRCAMWPHVSSIEHEQLLRKRFDHATRFATMVLVSDDRLLCGFVEVMRDMGLPGESPKLSLQALFVSPPMRRCGGATALLGAAQRWAHAHGACSLSCDLPLADNEARDNLRSLGFSANEQWVRMTLRVSAPLEVAPPGALDQPAADLRPQQGDARSVIQAASRDLSVPLLVVSEKAPRRLALIVNIILFVVAVVAFANTNIYAKDMLRGMLLPLLGVALVLYFLLVFVTIRYRKRADSNARVERFFRSED